MYNSWGACASFWWIVPIFMMILCFVFMRGRRWGTVCGFGRYDGRDGQSEGGQSAIEIIQRRYASGEIDKEEYEEKKRTLADSA